MIAPDAPGSVELIVIHTLYRPRGTSLPLASPDGGLTGEHSDSGPNSPENIRHSPVPLTVKTDRIRKTLCRGCSEQHRCLSKRDAGDFPEGLHESLPRRVSLDRTYRDPSPLLAKLASMSH